MKKTLLVSPLAALLLAGPSKAANFLVTNTNDSGAGSFRQAILDANATPGPDGIVFAIPAPPFVVTPLSALPAIMEQASIDGITSQPGAAPGAPVVVIDGASAGAGANGLVLAAGASASSVRGLIVDGFSGDGIDVYGSSSLVQGCWVGLDATGAVAAGNAGWGIYVGGSSVSIGGLTPAERNVVSGNGVSGAAGINVGAGSSSVVAGNFVGLDAAGTAAVSNGTGIVVNASATNAVIGGTNPGAGNVVSGNALIGIDVYGPATLQGNLVGTNAAGTAALPNGNGVLIRDTAPGSVVGGTLARARNVISGNTAYGLDVDAVNSTVQGNYIGTDVTGTAFLFNGGWTILLQPVGSTNILIGGTAPGTANILCGNAVWVNGGTGTAILGNSYPASGEIQLGPGGTPNDACDADTGPNNIQNFPVLTSAIVSGGSTTVTGSLNSTASTNFRIEFYRSAGTGAPTFLGSQNVATDPTCTTAINAVLPVALVATDSVLATATVITGAGTGFGDTSEFSATVGVTVPVELMRFGAE